MSRSNIQHSAVDPALGYLFQVRCALLWALEGLKGEEDFLVGVETLDDVAFQTSGGVPTDLLQTKHHQASAASLSNASSDLWKTLRVWFDGYDSGQIPQSAKLFLITTSEAPDGSVASMLRSQERNEPQAHSTLLDVARTAGNKGNHRAYQAFLKARKAVQLALLSRVVVIDSSPNILNIGESLRQEVFWAAGKKDHGAFLERLEGWWFQRVLAQLTSPTGERIGSVELENKMSDLRDQFKQASLPIDEDLLGFSLDEATRGTHVESNFVKQIELATTNGRRISNAIRDYYRAYEQRSRWVREDLVVGMELNLYEKRLKEEWEAVFEGMRDTLGEDETDQVMKVAAQSVLLWAELVSIPIRPSVSEPFLCRGSLHMLSDSGVVGWHPEFAERLSSLFGVSV